MYLGGSKSLGSGFRIGAYTRVSGGSPDGTTAAERRAEEREAFESEMLTRFESAVSDHMLSLGYAMPIEEYAEQELPAIAAIKEPMKNFLLQYKLAVDGKSLTPKRKDALLEDICAIEGAVKGVSPVHPIKGMLDQYNARPEKIKMNFCSFGWLIFILAIAAFIAATALDTDKQGPVVGAAFAGIAAGFILMIVRHAQKRSFKKNAKLAKETLLGEIKRKAIVCTLY
jgi:hypothetical protein